MARGRIYQQKHILKDKSGQPVIGPDGKPVMKVRSANWWISYYDANGKRHYESTESTKKGEAHRQLNLRLGAKEKGEVVGAQVGKVTFDAAVQAVIDDHTMNHRTTTREQGRITHHLAPYFTGRRMATITSADIRAYIVHRQAEDASNGTINREVQILRRAFKLAQEAQQLTSAPAMKRLDESEPRQGFFELAEFEAVRGKLPAYLQPLLTFYYFTGWRSSEALSLELRQVNIGDHTVRLSPSQSKNKQGREFPFGDLDELREVLTGQVASAERLTRDHAKIVTTVFHCPDGSAITELAFRKAWVAAREAAGYPAKYVHDFRRTAARNLVRAGVSEAVAMKLTGHKTRSMFDRYNITSGQDLRAAGALLQAYAVGKPKDTKKAGQVRPFKKRA